jgi:hypothetical protein
MSSYSSYINLHKGHLNPMLKVFSKIVALGNNTEKRVDKQNNEAKVLAKKAEKSIQAIIKEGKDQLTQQLIRYNETTDHVQSKEQKADKKKVTQKTQ